MTLPILIEHLANGLVVGAYYVTLALGLSLIFGLGGVINLAHGAFYALGAYLALEAQRLLGFGAALAISPFLVALLGMGIEAAFLRRLYRSDPLLGLLFTFGLAMVGEQLIRIAWGATGYPFDIPGGLRGFVTLGEFIYSRYRLFVIGVTALAIAALWLALEKTPYGMVVRAGTRDPEMVRALGISLRPVLTAVFGAGVALAGMAGVLSAPLAGVHPAMGTEIGTAAFVVVVIGGLGSFWGPVLAGLLVGEIRSLTVLFWPPAAEASMYALMALVLLLRPRGLLGERWEQFE
ncbi:MAG: branched-chain amino acid ABC transporter permease [Candidatus Rokubacteria bacterium]|nr:branched-chain amino acid ABC transporter permease [Candidatus Rokubacteria bacterium]